MKRSIRTVVIGDPQTIDLSFPLAKPGDTYTVDIQIKYPNGNIVSNIIEYNFVNETFSS